MQFWPIHSLPLGWARTAHILLCSSPASILYLLIFLVFVFLKSTLHAPSCPSWGLAPWPSPTSPLAHTWRFPIHTWGLGATGPQHVLWGTVCPSAGGSGAPALCSAAWPQSQGHFLQQAWKQAHPCHIASQPSLQLWNNITQV